jgi:hypothetical protein
MQRRGRARTRTCHDPGGAVKKFPFDFSFDINVVRQLNATTEDEIAVEDEASLLHVIDEDLKSGRKSQVAIFVNYFNQFAKCERGTETFKDRIDALPPCFLMLAKALNSTGGNLIIEFVGNKHWAQMQRWLTRFASEIDVNQVVRDLRTYANAAGDTQKAAADPLIATLLCGTLVGLQRCQPRELRDWLRDEGS